ncbi:MAG: PAS domain S-box protein [Ignavibacteriales bacterium]|nr:PAS domain S-box protein [Ignavibacteriales bacterium]
MKDSRKTKEQLIKELDALKGIEKYEELLIDEIPAMICKFKPDGVLTYVNKSCCIYFGKIKQELLNKNFINFIYKPDRKKIIVLSNILQSERKTYQVEFRVKLSNGEIKWHEWTYCPIQFNGSFQYQAVGRDITKRKNSEDALKESEQKYRAFIEQATDGFVLLDEEGKIIEWNKAHAAISGIPREEALGKFYNDVQFSMLPENKKSPQNNEYLKTVLNSALEKHEADFFYKTLEAEVQKPNGEQVFSQQTVFPIKTEKGIRLASVTRDITQQKLSEQALKEGESKFRLLADMLPPVVFETDIKGKLTFVNKSAFDQFKHNPEDFEKGLYIFDFVVPQDLARAKENIKKIITGEEIGVTEYILKKKDGTTFSAIIHSNAVINKNKRIGLRGIIIDISERKKVEESLKLSESRLRQVIDLVPHFIFAKNEKGQFILVNKAVAEAYGTSVEELLGKTDADFDPSVEEVNHFRGDDLEVIKSGLPKLIPEETITDSTGNLRTLQTTKIPFAFNGTTDLAILGVSIDITENKKTEEAMQKSALQFRLVWEHSSDGMRLTDENGIIIEVNDAYCKMVEKTRNELIGNPFSVILLSQITANVVQKYQTRFKQRLERTLERQVKLWNNKQIWFELSEAYFEMTGERPLMLTIFRNITERKRTEEILAKSEERFRSMIQGLSDLINLLDTNGTIIYESPSVSKILGYDPGYMIGKNCFDFIHPDDIPSVSSDLMEVRENNNNGIPTEFRIKHANGNYIFMESVAKNLLDNSEINGILVTSRNVTERKESEKKILESEERYKAFIGQTAEGISCMELDIPMFLELSEKEQAEFFINHAYLVECNDAFARMYGYNNIREVIGHKLSDFWCGTFEEQKNSLLSWVRNNFKLENAITVEKSKDGKTLYFLNNTIGIIENNRLIRVWGTQRDNTEQRKAEEALRESEQRWQFALEGSGDGVWDWDIEKNKFYYSRRWKEMHGYNPEDIVDDLNDWKERTHPEDIDYVQSEVYRLFNGESQVYESEHRVKCKNGNYIWILDRGKVISWSADGKPARMVGTHTDISSRKIQEEKARKKTEQIFRQQAALLKLAKLDENNFDISIRKILESDANAIGADRVGFWKINEANTETTCAYLYKRMNDSFEKSANLKLSNLYRYIKLLNEFGFVTISDVNNDERALDILEQYLKPNKITSMFTIPVWVEGKIIGFINHEHIGHNREWSIDEQEFGNSIADLITLSFITAERAKAEKEILKLSRAIDQSPASVILTDLAGRIEYVNPKFTQVTGYTPEEVIGQNPRILKTGEMSSENYKELWETISMGKEWRGEFLNKKKNEELFWESASISPIKNGKGEVINYLAVKEDITDKKMMDIELKQALDRAEESSKLKSSLLANMSHELRTPMNGILGFAQLLAEEITEPFQKQMVQKIQHSSKRLMMTLNTILDLSELESNEFLLTFNEVKIGALLFNILKEYEEKAKQKGLYFEYERPENDISALVDETVLNKIIINLVDNAIKFTVKGGIKIKLENEDRGEDGFIAKVQIIDSGIGIADKDKELIFHEFRQASEGLSRSYEGSGLGLTLARKMARLINGDINVDSQLGVGSTFTLTIPGVLGEVLNPELNAPPEIVFKENKNVSFDILPEVLLVEDNIINKEVVEVFLRGICKVDHAIDGLGAIKMAFQKEYAIVLMDINLGTGMNGVDVFKELKKIKGYEKVPIVAITGYAMSGDKEKFISQGMTNYLAKPFDKELLIKVIFEILANK